MRRHHDIVLFIALCANNTHILKKLKYPPAVKSKTSSKLIFAISHTCTYARWVYHTQLAMMSFDKIFDLTADVCIFIF